MKDDINSLLLLYIHILLRKSERGEMFLGCLS